ncbi:MAG: VWA domain-containing protein [Ectothiorhodospiraceae bacterium]|nr:VWA domain-containing protein [Ectothiorhodospiraceae bacterium]
MLQLAWPWVLALLALPLALRRLLPQHAVDAEAAVRVPYYREVVALPAARRPTPRDRLRIAAAVLAWVALVLAAARPQWIGGPLAPPMSGRDLVLAVDLSQSMSEHDQLIDDGTVDRLDAVKHIVGGFLERRVGDRVGLVLFGNRPYIQVPLTYDRAMARRLLGEAVVGLAGSETAIGDALALAVQMLRERPVESRVVVLLTDGENTAGRMSPLDAARLAAFHGVRVHTVGIGSGAEAGAPRGSASAPSAVAFDDRMLRMISETTGGRSFHAADGAGLARVHNIIDSLEPTVEEDATLRPAREIFHWPLGLAWLLAAALVLEHVLARSARRHPDRRWLGAREATR